MRKLEDDKKYGNNGKFLNSKQWNDKMDGRLGKDKWKVGASYNISLFLREMIISLILV